MMWASSGAVEPQRESQCVLGSEWERWGGTWPELGIIFVPMSTESMKKKKKKRIVSLVWQEDVWEEK